MNSSIGCHNEYSEPVRKKNDAIVDEIPVSMNSTRKLPGV